ncbi:MAG: hypothetical protein V4694_04600 [Pseudomonadota bacterium]
MSKDGKVINATENSSSQPTQTSTFSDIIYGISIKYANQKAYDSYPQNHDTDKMPRYAIATKATDGIFNYETRLFDRIRTIYDEDAKKNGELNLDQRDYLIEKLAAFFASRPAHQVTLSSDCLNKNKTVAFIHPGIATVAVTAFKAVTDNLYVPDYIIPTGKTDKEKFANKELYKEVIQSAFSAVRTMTMSELSAETEYLIQQRETRNPMLTPAAMAAYADATQVANHRGKSK